MGANVKKYLAVAAITLSAAGATFIARWEGMKTEAYVDPVGIPTICSGHTRGVFVGQKATLGQCEAWLVEDATYAGDAVKRCTHMELTQEQYDALVSLAFNIGGTAYCRSTLAKKLNAGDCYGAAAEFERWNRAGGRVLPGLVKRRAAERRLFETGCGS